VHRIRDIPYGPYGDMMLYPQHSSYVVKGFRGCSWCLHISARTDSQIEALVIQFAKAIIFCPSIMLRNSKSICNLAKQRITEFCQEHGCPGGTWNPAAGS
jgi:hypothetical protein